jgi:hypothetical protein
MARNKKNELDLLLGAIKKSLNNKTTLTNEDIATAMEVLEVNKLKKDLLDNVEELTGLKYVNKIDIKTSLEIISKILNEELKKLKKIEDEEVVKRKKENEEKNKNKAKKTENVNEAQETQNQ